MATKKTTKKTPGKPKTIPALKPKKKRSQIDAAIQVLTRARKPMTCKARIAHQPQCASTRLTV